jgi:hypothetical protein
MHGFAHVPNGVHGRTDLMPAKLDWRNPVAQVVLERMT